MAVPTLTANSPVAGSISWSAFNIRYGGVSYAIPASSTSKKYVWWVYNNGSPILTADDLMPTNLTADDIVLFVNKGGIPINIPSASTVDGSLIVDGTIAGEALIANSVDTLQLKAGAVKTETLDAEVLRAGFTLTGRLQVGESYMTPEDGLVIPQPDGSTTRFPADGLTPAQVSGHLKAKSLTVEKDLVLNGSTNQIQGQIKLANGITAPNSAPSIYPAWDSRYSELLDNSNGGFQVFRGMTSAANANHISVGVNFFGSGIRVIDKNTGGLVFYPDPTNGKSWTQGFNAHGGLGFGNSHYFMYGTDNNRNGDWYIYKINANYDKVAELRIGGLGVHNSNNLRITASSVTGGVYLVYCNNENQVRMLTWDTNLGFLNDVLLWTAAAPRNIEALYVGPADFGAGNNKILVGSREDGMVYAWNLANTARESQWDFPMGHGAKIQGLHYDTQLGKLMSFDQEGRIVHYTAQQQTRQVTASYTWYDGDGTVRETTPSPVATATWGARTLGVIETPAPPDSGVTDPSRVDKANRVGIYIGQGGAARRRQIYLGVDGNGVSLRKHTFAVPVTNLNTEPTSNTFGGANVPPGLITSAALDGSGNPLLEASGSGQLKVDGRRIYGQPILGRNIGTVGAQTNPIYNGSRGIVYSRYDMPIPSGARMAYCVVHTAARATINSSGGWDLFAGRAGNPWEQIDARWLHNEGDQYKVSNTSLSGWINLYPGDLTMSVKCEAWTDASGGGWTTSPGGIAVHFFG